MMSKERQAVHFKSAQGQQPIIRNWTFLVIILFAAFDLSASEFTRGCYFQSWAHYRTNVAKFAVNDIDPYLCTHLIYAFADIDTANKQLVPREPGVELGSGLYSQFNDLKQRNPGLKTLLSVGGQNAVSSQFIVVASSDDALLTFSRNVVAFLRIHGFDGLDIDWEYPNATSKGVFTNLVKSLRSAFDDDKETPKLLLTFAGPAGQWNIDPGYDIPEIAKYVDYAYLMTYDYTGANAEITAFNSPLYSRNDPRFNPAFSTNWTVHYWNSKGMPLNKIVVGFTGVGRHLVLKNATHFVPGSETTKQIRNGKYYNLEGGLAYPEICELLTLPNTSRFFDAMQMNPYLVNADNWVGYEDKQSLGVKIVWMKNLGVAGIFFWALDYDDFSGKICHDGKYPLLNVVMSMTGPPQPETTTGNNDPALTTQSSTNNPALTTQSSTNTRNGEFLRVCYFPSWTIYRGNIAKFDVADIDPNLCSHLVYAFGKINTTSKQLEALEAWSEEGPDGKFRRFNKLKQTNPSLKTLLSIGGQNVNKNSFQAIAETNGALFNFARTSVIFLRDRGFDGLDIDWEYPESDTKTIFVKLLQSLRAAFNADTSGPKLLLTVAGAAGKWNIDPGYDVPEVARTVDFINLMTYDYTDTASQVTAFNSPLYSRGDPRFNPTLSTNWTVHYWNRLGMPFNKIAVGITGVGRRLVLQHKTQTAPGSAVTGQVRTGHIYYLDGGLAYPEICELLKKTSTTRTFDEEQKNPYLVNGDDWVGYEDEESIGIKLEWMRSLGVAGIMFWALDQDDFTGQLCGQGKYPLLNVIRLKTLTTVATISTTTADVITASGSTEPPTTSSKSVHTSHTDTTTEIKNLLSTEPNGCQSSLQISRGLLLVFTLWVFVLVLCCC